MAIRKPTIRVYKGRPLTPEEAIGALKRAETAIGKAKKGLRPSAGAAVGGGILDAVMSELSEIRKELKTGEGKVIGHRVVRKGA